MIFYLVVVLVCKIYFLYKLHIIKLNPLYKTSPSGSQLECSPLDWEVSGSTPAESEQ